MPCQWFNCPSHLLCQLINGSLSFALPAAQRPSLFAMPVAQWPLLFAMSIVQRPTLLAMPKAQQPTLICYAHGPTPPPPLISYANGSTALSFATPMDQQLILFAILMDQRPSYLLCQLVKGPLSFTMPRVQWLLSFVISMTHALLQ